VPSTIETLALESAEALKETDGRGKSWSQHQVLDLVIEFVSALELIVEELEVLREDELVFGDEGRREGSGNSSEPREVTT